MFLDLKEAIALYRQGLLYGIEYSIFPANWNPGISVVAMNETTGNESNFFQPVYIPYQKLEENFSASTRSLKPIPT